MLSLHECWRVSPPLLAAEAWCVTRAQNGIDSAGSTEGLVTRHEVWTWELLHILFSHISAADDASGGAAHAMDTLGQDEGEEPAAGARKRRALLSCWLRVRALAQMRPHGRRGPACWCTAYS